MVNFYVLTEISVCLKIFKLFRIMLLFQLSFISTVDSEMFART